MEGSLNCLEFSLNVNQLDATAGLETILIQLVSDMLNFLGKNVCPLTLKVLKSLYFALHFLGLGLHCKFSSKKYLQSREVSKYFSKKHLPEGRGPATATSRA